MNVSFDPLAQTCSSQRSPIYARGAKVNCSSPLASAAGPEALRRGHQIRSELNTPSLSRGQMILRLDNGAPVGGTESRTDSDIACCQRIPGRFSFPDDEPTAPFRIEFTKGGCWFSLTQWDQLSARL